MIPVNDLRIGNYIKFKSASQKNKDKWVRVDSMCEWEGGENLIAIDITPELLEKCGFKKIVYENTTRFEHKDMNCFFVFYSKGVHKGKIKLFFICGFQPERKPTSLHQLQNLFYSLTGKELEITF